MKYAQPHLGKTTTQEIADLKAQNAKLISEVARLEGERDSARKAARAWKRAAKRLHFLNYIEVRMSRQMAAKLDEIGAK